MTAHILKWEQLREDLHGLFVNAIHKAFHIWGWGALSWEFGISRCKLLYVDWINNKILLYSTGNYIQYPVINYNGKEYIYIYKTESLCCIPETNTALQIKHTSITKKKRLIRKKEWGKKKLEG